MSYETFLEDLHAVRDRAGRFRLRAGHDELADTLLGGALEELDVALEELLRVTEEEVRAQQEAVDGGGRRGEAERERYQALFVLAPAAYLVTDPAGLIREANLRAVALLGIDHRFVTGRPLVSFVGADDRARFRDRITRLAREETGDWRTTLCPRGREPVPVTVSVAVGRDPRGNVQELRWLLWPPAVADQSAVAAVPVMPAPEPTTDPPGLDNLAATLHEVADAAALLVRADGAGLMLADQAGALRWVTATGEAEQAFERAQRDLDEGPCIDAFARNEVVRSTDLRADPRWPRLGPAVATNRIRGVLSVPVGLGADMLGTCNAITHSPRGWTDADAAAIVAFGAVIGRLLRTTTEARRKGDLAVQLQAALDSRIVVEQAKGVLMEREGLSAQAAFERLRRQARSRSMRIDDLARQLIAGRRAEPPPPPGR